jgi:hypothetical protein
VNAGTDFNTEYHRDRVPSGMDMKTTLLHRLQKLEAQAGPENRPVYLYGWTKPLGKSHEGERHVMMTERQATGSPFVAWCSFQECEGPAPADCIGKDVLLPAHGR